MRIIFLIFIGLSLISVARADDSSKATQTDIKTSSEKADLPKITPPCDPKNIPPIPKTFY
ncbi:MAG: hypothetical protein JSR85_01380 [Proteobacteria bacterium]|nr:hypothetical protein [Pseudomonadota bacterium]